MALRIQKERIDDLDGIDVAQIQREFRLDHDSIGAAKPNVKIMHPGPMNRDIEITSALADDRSRSLILNQVANGVPTRMAVLDMLVTREL